MKQVKIISFGLLLILSMTALIMTSCEDEVTNPVESITLDITTLDLLTGETPVAALVATITPADATDSVATWTTSDATRATVSEGSVTAIAAGTVTITAEAGGKTATCTVTITTLPASGSVTINGVSWATCNVSSPGTFASSPSATGMFYQWDSPVAWPATGDIGSITASDGSTTWNSSWKGSSSSPSSSDTWTTANDPSPTGYRVPTFTELESLCATASVTNTWTTINGVKGMKFEDNTSGNAIFLPLTGYRSNTSGALSSVEYYGVYWSGVAYSSGFSRSKEILEEEIRDVNYNRAIGGQIRPVAE